MRHWTRAASPILLALLLAGATMSGCEDGLLVVGDEGSGNLVTETRELGSFTEIELSGAVKLDLVVDAAAAQSVTVTYDDNIIDRVVTEVRGDTLVVELTGSVSLTGSADRHVAVTIHELRGLDVSGASTIDATGTVASYRLDASGASKTLLRELLATDVAIDVSGASSVELFATGTVSGSLSGASNLEVYGEPVRVLVDSSGASSVDIKGE